ncbi:MAG: hypothetical protein QM713_05715 [Arachnia sp.]
MVTDIRGSLAPSSSPMMPSLVCPASSRASAMPRRSLNDELYGAGVGPAHWKVFYDTLDKFPTSGPIPAPPQQAAVESALIKNVVASITNGKAGVRRGLETMQRDLEIALGGR